MSLALTGLDGSNPRDFLAAAGLLVAGPDSWAISWTDEGVWRPTLHGADEIDEVIDAIDRDREGFASSEVLKIEHQGKRDLKLPPAEVRGLFERVLADGSNDAALLCCLLSEVAVDGNGMSKPTGFHFTAGNQLFIKMWAELQHGVTRAALKRDLVETGPSWSKLPTMSWDSEGGHPYALRADDPSKVKRLSRPGREWLALRALALLPSAPSGPRGDRLETALLRGRWGQAKMTWPVWTVPTGRAAVAALLLRDAKSLTVDQRRLLSLGAVFEAGIRRSESGGYGSFTPARQV